jgi:acyl carrier protein
VTDLAVLDEIHAALRSELLRLGVDQRRIVPSARLFTDLGLDSLELTGALINVEERFGVDITDEASSVETIGELAEVIARRKAQAS